MVRSSDEAEGHAAAGALFGGGGGGGGVTGGVEPAQAQAVESLVSDTDEQAENLRSADMSRTRP